MKYFYDILAVLLMYLPSIVAAQTPQTEMRISHHLDSSHTTTTEDILNGTVPLKRSAIHSYNFKFTTNTAWFKLERPRSDQPMVITIENAHLDSIDAYFWGQSGRNTRSFHTGDLRPFDTRDLKTNFFSFVSLADDSIIIFKVRTSGLLAVPISVENIQGFYEYDMFFQIAYWMFIGTALLSFFASLVFYFNLNDNTYLYYCLYVVGNIAFSSVDVEATFHYLWPNHPALNKLNLFLYALEIFMFIFCRRFLQTAQYAPKIDVGYLILIGGYLCISLASLYDYMLSTYLLTCLLIIAPVYVLFSILYIYLKTRNRVLLYFFGAWAIYLSGVLFYMLSILGIIKYTGNISATIPLFSAFEMLAMFLSVTSKVNQIKKANDLAHVRVIELLEANEELLMNQKQYLEEQVLVRTQELSILNEEILAQNEKIISQNDKLVKSHDLLETRTLALNNSNEELKKYKYDLEAIIEQRTRELQHTNENLAFRNEQMEQFSFMAAHNLRSPVAAILGLTDIAKISTSDTQTLLGIIERIEKSAQKLDIVIKTLNTMLSTNNKSDRHLTLVNIKNIFEETANMLSSEIADSGAQISYHSEPEHIVIKSVYSYIHNLFLNLIGNSLKYKKNESPLHIEIYCTLAQDHCKMVFKDNGQGIDLNKFGKDIFKPFKRFSVNADGTGLGLFIIKTQVTSLGGSIQVQSVPEQGCTFEVILPSQIPLKGLGTDLPQ